MDDFSAAHYKVVWRRGAEQGAFRIKNRETLEVVAAVYRANGFSVAMNSDPIGVPKLLAVRGSK